MTKKKKDKVPIVDTLSVLEASCQGNPATPVINQEANGDGRRNVLVTPTPNHHGSTRPTSSPSCQTPYIEVLMEEDLHPTPPEEDSLGNETGDKDNDPPLQEGTLTMEPHNLTEEDLESPTTPTNNSVLTTNQEGNSKNNITVTQMVGDLHKDARIPIVNPYSLSSSNAARRTGREQNQNQNRNFLDM
eukprot:13951620-Ditylum_brightwellii.AAC.1